MGLKLVLTGFGPFGGVEENPTQLLVERVLQLWEAGQLDLAGAELAVATTLRVAARDVGCWLGKTCASLGDAGAVLFVHLGVETKSTVAKMERAAYNLANFRIPDEDGWQPRDQPVDAHCGAALGAALTTDLDLAAVLGRLQDVAPGQVQMSDDPGRFVCNYTYFLSLLHCADAARAGKWHALFFHVPPLEHMGEEQQLRIVRALLAELCRLCAPAAADGAPCAQASAAVAAAAPA